RHRWRWRRDSENRDRAVAFENIRRATATIESQVPASGNPPCDVTSLQSGELTRRKEGPRDYGTTGPKQDNPKRTEDKRQRAKESGFGANRAPNFLPALRRRHTVSGVLRPVVEPARRSGPIHRDVAGNLPALSK